MLGQISRNGAVLVYGAVEVVAEPAGAGDPGNFRAN